MANQYGINLGEVYRTVEAVKSSRQQRKQSNQLMDWQQADRDLANEQRRQAGERENMLAPIRQQAAAGDQTAQRQLIALSPEEGIKITEAVSKMDERGRAQVQENVEMMGRLAAFILNAENPEQAFSRVRNSVPEEMRRQMPDRYDQDWVMMELARAQEVDQLLKDTVLTIGGEDVRVRGGVDIERTTSNALLREQEQTKRKSIEAMQKAAPEMNASDANTIYRQTVELLGGVFDQDGKIQIMSKDNRNKVQSIAEEAARLYSSGEAKTHSQAVAMAGRKQGLIINSLQGQGVNPEDLIKHYVE